MFLVGLVNAQGLGMISGQQRPQDGSCLCIRLARVVGGPEMHLKGAHGGPSLVIKLCYWLHVIAIGSQGRQEGMKTWRLAL